MGFDEISLVAWGLLGLGAVIGFILGYGTCNVVRGDGPGGYNCLDECDR